jgi:GNAT superfamily N-acetyltransferase
LFFVKRGDPRILTKGYSVRHAEKKDSQAVISLLKGLANFEHLDPPDRASQRRIIRDVFSKKLAWLLVAVDSDSGKLVGYALYFFTYSSFLARPSLYLEDIFVLEEYRSRGVGRELFLSCVREARRNGCSRMEWAVLTWNKNAIQFYENLGAKRLEDWHYYRLTEEAMHDLSIKKTNS